MKPPRLLPAFSWSPKPLAIQSDNRCVRIVSLDISKNATHLWITTARSRTELRLRYIGANRDIAARCSNCWSYANGSPCPPQSSPIKYLSLQSVTGWCRLCSSRIPHVGTVNAPSLVASLGEIGVISFLGITKAGR